VEVEVVVEVVVAVVVEEELEPGVAVAEPTQALRLSEG
jgi:hypothetical protein